MIRYGARAFRIVVFSGYFLTFCMKTINHKKPLKTNHWFFPPLVKTESGKNLEKPAAIKWAKAFTAETWMNCPSDIWCIHNTSLKNINMLFLEMIVKVLFSISR